MNNNIHNPDVLSCLANLSSDEVFTPPEIANAMLDLLPQELFSDPSVTFLDPCCKSGVLPKGSTRGWKLTSQTGRSAWNTFSEISSSASPLRS